MTLCDHRALSGQNLTTSIQFLQLPSTNHIPHLIYISKNTPATKMSAPSIRLSSHSSSTLITTLWDTMGDLQQPPHIVVLPSPGMGHLIPLVQFAKRLVSLHDVSVTFFVPSDNSPLTSQKAILDSLPKSISYIFLPPVDVGDLPGDVRIETRMYHTNVRSLPSLRDALRRTMESACVVALVVDLFGLVAFEVAEELSVGLYLFYTTTAAALSLGFETEKLDETYTGEYRDMPELVKLPGCVPLHGGDFPSPYQERTNEAYACFVDLCKRYKKCEGILVNSFLELEPGASKALMEEKPGKPVIYPVGPIVQRGGTNESSADVAECLRWLDEQPRGSVVYVSFGSGGTLSEEQFAELAYGLEMSQQRFLWVVRSPIQTSSEASFFNPQSVENPFDFLPEGFLARTKGRGFVVSSWAPQIQVLAHASTGGFLTHCGWNSTLESIVHGVPLIAWPLYAEQKMNAVMLDDMKVALRVKPDENGLISRLEIADIVKELMEGEEGKAVRTKVNDLKEAATRALSDHGSSTESLSKVVRRWKSIAN